MLSEGHKDEVSQETYRDGDLFTVDRVNIPLDEGAALGRRPGHPHLQEALVSRTSHVTPPKHLVAVLPLRRRSAATSQDHVTRKSRDLTRVPPTIHNNTGHSWGRTCTTCRCSRDNDGAQIVGENQGRRGVRERFLAAQAVCCPPRGQPRLWGLQNSFAPLFFQAATHQPLPTCRFTGSHRRRLGLGGAGQQSCECPLHNARWDGARR